MPIPKPIGKLANAIAEKRFAVTAEIGPPRGAVSEPIRRKARLLRDWVDAANITDNQSAVVRLSSIAGSVIAMQEGIEPVFQLQCRDRNRIALQADLIGAGALGIPNILCLTGDHPRFGDHPDAKPVFDLDSVQLLWTARTMRDQKELLSRKSIPTAPKWLIGGVENPFAPPHRWRAERLGKKIAAGAQFIQTQYVYDVPMFERFMEDVRALGLHERCAILAGIGPVKTLRALEHMRAEVPGMHIPDSVVKRLKGVPEDKVSDEGLKLAVELVQQMKEIKGVAGVHIMAFGWEEAVPEILVRAGLRSSPESGSPTQAPIGVA